MVVVVVVELLRGRSLEGRVYREAQGAGLVEGGCRTERQRNRKLRLLCDPPLKERGGAPSGGRLRSESTGCGDRKRLIIHQEQR